MKWLFHFHGKSIYWVTTDVKDIFLKYQEDILCDLKGSNHTDRWVNQWLFPNKISASLECTQNAMGNQRPHTSIRLRESGRGGQKKSF